MTDWGLKTISSALLIESNMPTAEMRQFTGVRRRVSKEERSRIVAECEQPGVCLATVARRNRVPLDSLRRWVRLVVPDQALARGKQRKGGDEGAETLHRSPAGPTPVR